MCEVDGGGGYKGSWRIKNFFVGGVHVHCGQELENLEK